MKITVESTTKLVDMNGVPARIWQGQTESGIHVHVYITRIAIDLEADRSEFDRELLEQRAPRAEIAAIPLRLVL